MLHYNINIPHEYLCPISHLIMREPVITNTGICYEKEQLEAYMKTNSLYPVTQIKIDTCIPNVGLKNLIDTFLSTHPDLIQQNEVNLPASFWVKLEKAIIKDAVSEFNTLIKLDPRLLTLTPEDSLITGLTVKNPLLPTDSAEKMAEKYNARQIQAVLCASKTSKTPISTTSAKQASSEFSFSSTPAQPHKEENRPQLVTESPPLKPPSCKVSTGTADHRFTFFVKTCQGNTITLHNNSQMTIGDLKTAIRHALPTLPLPDEQRLIYAGKLLQDNEIAQENTTIHMVLPLKGN